MSHALKETDNHWDKGRCPTELSWNSKCQRHCREYVYLISPSLPKNTKRGISEKSSLHPIWTWMKHPVVSLLLRKKRLRVFECPNFCLVPAFLLSPWKTFISCSLNTGSDQFSSPEPGTAYVSRSDQPTLGFKVTLAVFAGWPHPLCLDPILVSRTCFIPHT